LSLTTLLPSAHVAAQSFGYNPNPSNPDPGNPDLGEGRGNDDYERILIGVGIVTALYYLIDGISGNNDKNVPAGAGASNRNQQNNGRGPNPGPGNSGNAPAGGPR
jgi:hypothetical protein